MNGLDPDQTIEAAVTTMLARSLERDDKTGRFTRGLFKTGQESELFWESIGPAKVAVVDRVRAQLGIEDGDPRETLSALIDGFAEAHLLRKSTFVQLAKRGGPLTAKGKVRGLLSAWGQFFDREMRAAERLGLVSVPKKIETPAEWLARLSAESDARTDQQTEQGRNERTETSEDN